MFMFVYGECINLLTHVSIALFPLLFQLYFIRFTRGC